MARLEYRGKRAVGLLMPKAAIVRCQAVRVGHLRHIDDDEWAQLDPFIISGGMDDPPTWTEYLAFMPMDLTPYLCGIRAAIEAEKLTGVAASDFCNYHYWEADDGVRIVFTWRAWGDLMQAIVGKRQGYWSYYC